MAKINKIKLPDGVTYDVIDASKSGVYTVKGTQTATTASWTGNIDVDALYDGLTIAYYLPRTSASNVTLNLTLADGTTTTGAIPVYVTGEARMGTHYAAGSTIMLTYWSAGSISVNGTATTSARWTHSDCYISNTDTKVRQTLATGDTNRPLLMAYSDNTVTTGNVDNVSYRNNSIYANPSTGTITATKFVGDISEGTGLTSSQVTTALGYTPIQTESDPTVPSWAKASSKPSYSASEISGLGTAATKDIPSSGNASSTQVVMGSDSRLSDARPSSDVVETYSATSTVPISGKGVAAALATLPEPMVFKGTLGTGGTITSLPTAAASNEGFTYKVITAGTYASQSAKVGDVFVSNGSAWVIIPSGDDTVTDTWRNIKVNGTEKIGTGISTGAVDFVNGTNTTVTYTASGNKVAINATDTNTWRPVQLDGVGLITDDTTPLNFVSGTNVTISGGLGTDLGKVIIAATDTKYTANTISIGSASAGTAIAADDITAWTTNTPTSCAISNGVLTFTAGSAASLSYTAKSIPNISVTSKTVATGITAS